jgi:hypothetical protein
MKEKVYGMKIIQKPSKWIDEFQEIYGPCDYEINEYDEITDINSFKIRQVVANIPKLLNRVIRHDKDSKERLKETLTKLLEGDKDDSQEAKLLCALIKKDFPNIIEGLRCMGISFNINDEERLNICDFVNKKVREMVDNLLLMIEEEQKELVKPGIKEEKISWADRVSPGRQVRATFEEKSDISKLYKAAANNQLAEAEGLLKSGVSPNAAEGIYGNLPLHIATFCRHSDMIKLLLEYSANPEQPNKKGITAISINAEDAEMNPDSEKVLQIKELLHSKLCSPTPSAHSFVRGI